MTTTQMTVKDELRFADRLHLATLYTMLHVIDTEGEEAVPQFDDSDAFFDFRTLMKALLSDPETREERLAFLLCTLRQV